MTPPQTKTEITRTPDGARLVIEGDITEEWEAPVFGASHPARISVDLGGVRRFNSSGVTRWLRLVDELDNGRVALELENVPDAFVAQWAMIAAMAPPGAVRSLRVTHFCEECETAESVTLSRDRDFPDGRLVAREGPICRYCGKSMPLDTLLEAIDL